MPKCNYCEEECKGNLPHCDTYTCWNKHRLSFGHVVCKCGQKNVASLPTCSFCKKSLEGANRWVEPVPAASSSSGNNAQVSTVGTVGGGMRFGFGVVLAVVIVIIAYFVLRIII